MPMETNYLAHYGILGMHWGIRRFQPYPKGYTGKGKYAGPKVSFTRNVKKGHITTKGVKELNRLASSDAVKSAVSEHNAREERFKKRHGIQTINEKTDLVPKGIGIVRVANDEPLDDKRKYVALNETNDSNDYTNRPDGIGADIGKKIYRYDFDLKKDIKVAPASEVNKFMLDEYGQVPLKDLYINPKILDEFYIGKGSKEAQKAIKDVGNIKIGEFMREQEQLDAIKRTHHYGDPLGKNGWAVARASIGQQALIGFMYKKLVEDKNSMDDVCKEFKSRGYDAIIDPQDKAMNFDYPMILLNPSDSLTMKSKELIWPVTERDKKRYEEARSKVRNSSA